MNLGKRIEKRLNELGWERGELLNRVPDLSPQNLSNLIRRDSKRSEFDRKIADALGVTLDWLVFGDNPVGEIPATQSAEIRQHPAAYQPYPAAVMQVIDIMLKLDEAGMQQILGMAKAIAISEQQADRNSIKRAGL